MHLLTRGVSALARVGAALGRDRLLHPAGVLFEATLTVHRGLPLREGDHRALVRLSKATPTPAGWPDILGLAMRVYVEGGPLDLALATTGRAVGVRHLLVPRRDFARSAFTSLLPYRVGDDLRLVGAMPEGAGTGRPPVYTIVLASVTGSWEPVATLTVHGHADGDVAFDVVANAVPGIRPAGWLNRLRGPVYRASQRARRRNA